MINIAKAYDLMVKLPGYEEVTPSLSGYLQWMFIFIVSAAGILALLMIMIGGFQYITAAGNESRAGQAKSRIQNAIIGLILALCSYLILNTINPDLVNPSLPGLTQLNPSDFSWDDYLKEFPKAGDAKHNLPDGALCSKHADCYYSRICADTNSFFCPNDPAKIRHSTAEKCYAAKNDTGATFCDPSQETSKCIQGKVCEPIFFTKGSDEGKIFDPKTKTLLIPTLTAYGFKCQTNEDCFDNIGSKSLDIPANPNIVCNHGKGAICAEASKYWDLCNPDKADCAKEDRGKTLFCDKNKDNGRCNTTDLEPPSDIPSEGSDPSSPTGQLGLYQDTIYSIKSYKEKDFAIISNLYKWSGLQRCDALEGNWNDAREDKKSICQYADPNGPKKLAQPGTLGISCDGIEKCTAYQWETIMIVDASEGTFQRKKEEKDRCSQRWEEETNTHDCLTYLEKGNLVPNHPCCKYDIVCCESIISGEKELCQKLGADWTVSEHADYGDCIEALKSNDYFEQNEWITKWFIKSSDATPIPGICCQKIATEQEQTQKDGWGEKIEK